MTPLTLTSLHPIGRPELRSQGPPTEVKSGKSGKWHFWGQKMPFGGSPLEPFKWGFGAFNSLPQYQILAKGGNLNAPKTPFKWFQGGPPKRHFLTPKMSFSRFSTFDLCRGTLGSQAQNYLCSNCLWHILGSDKLKVHMEILKTHIFMLVSPASRKATWTFLVQKSQIGQECQALPTFLGVNFGGESIWGLKPWRSKT